MRSVPDALHVAIFGRIGVGEDGTECATGLPTKTYSIFDAAKVFGLPEMLEGSGLEHRCLFKGKALEDFRDVAPWIVSLDEGNSFVRKSFTCGNEPWHLWDKEPGIFIRSNASLDELWGHFRKFTRIYDEARGKWFYWRFWDAAVLRSFIPHLAQDEHRMFSRHIEAFVGCTRDGRCTIIRYGD